MKWRQYVNFAAKCRTTSTLPLAGLLLVAACSGNSEQALEKGSVAQAQLEAGQISAARQTIAEAIAERDDLVDLQLLRGRIDLAAGDQKGALRAYDSALGLDATNLEALQAVGQLSLRTGDMDKSKAAADRILTLQPNQPDALLLKGIHAMIQNRADEALEWADKVLKQDPVNEGAAILKARALFYDGKAPEALTTIETRESSAGDTAAIAATKLELLREAHNASGMLAVFQSLRKLQPDNVEVRLDEANVRYKMGDAGAARKLLISVLQARVVTREDLAGVIGLWREYDAMPLSRTDQAALVRLAPDRRLAVARYYLAVGQPNMARVLLRGLTGLDAQGLAARAAAAEGRSGYAAQLADAVLNQDETQCDALLARSRVAQPTQGIYAAQRAVSECPQDAGAALALAAGYQRAGDRDGILRTFADAVTRIPQDSGLSRAFTTWLEGQGKRRQAVGEGRRLTRKAPALLSGWQNYRRVCARIAEADCEQEADAGLRRAQSLLAVDPAPGKLEPKGLSGRLRRQ